jgi:heptosyltransferase-3
MQRILVLRGGALGDFLVTLPALSLLRARWPGATIDLVGNATAAALGREAGLLDQVESQHARHWGELHAADALSNPMRDRLARYDLVLNFWPDPAAQLAAHFPVRPGQVFLTSSAHPTVAPAATHFCRPLRQLGLTSPTLHFQLGQPDPSIGGIALHPGSGSARKNWPAERWAEIADWLHAEYDHPVFIISGEAEPPALLAGHGEPWRNLPLPELAARLSRCRLFLGHDSGVSHLAAAMGIPGLLLFGPTDPTVWAPPCPQVRVLRNGPAVADLTSDDVRQTVAAILRDQT